MLLQKNEAKRREEKREQREKEDSCAKAGFFFFSPSFLKGWVKGWETSSCWRVVMRKADSQFFSLLLLFSWVRLFLASEVVTRGPGVEGENVEKFGGRKKESRRQYMYGACMWMGRKKGAKKLTCMTRIEEWVWQDLHTVAKQQKTTSKTKERIRWSSGSADSNSAKRRDSKNTWRGNRNSFSMCLSDSSSQSWVSVHCETTIGFMHSRLM